MARMPPAPMDDGIRDSGRTIYSHGSGFRRNPGISCIIRITPCAHGALSKAPPGGSPGSGGRAMAGRSRRCTAVGLPQTCEHRLQVLPGRKRQGDGRGDRDGLAGLRVAPLSFGTAPLGEGAKPRIGEFRRERAGTRAVVLYPSEEIRAVIEGITPAMTGACARHGQTDHFAVRFSLTRDRAAAKFPPGL